MKGIWTSIGLALAPLVALTVAGCTDLPTQQAERWSGQYDSCYGNAFTGSAQAPAADRQDTRTLEHCLKAQGWTAQS